MPLGESKKDAVGRKEERKKECTQMSHVHLHMHIRCTEDFPNG